MPHCMVSELLARWIDGMTVVLAKALEGTMTAMLRVILRKILRTQVELLTLAMTDSLSRAEGRR